MYKQLIIDSNFRGLEKRGEFYCYKGHIIDYEITVKIPLYVYGIEQRLYSFVTPINKLETFKDFCCDHNVESEGIILAHKDFSCNNLSVNSIIGTKIKVNQIHAEKIICDFLMTNEIICREASIKRIEMPDYGIISERFDVYNNYRYKIYVMEEHIAIGCQLYLRNEWRNFSDDEIESMDEEGDSLSFWKRHKDEILNL